MYNTNATTKFKLLAVAKSPVENQEGSVGALARPVKKII